MELILNRVKYTYKVKQNDKIIISNKNDLIYRMQWQYFIDRFDEKEELIKWAEDETVTNDDYVSYEFSSSESETYFSVSLIKKFYHKHQMYLIAQGLLKQGFIVDFNPKTLSLSCYIKTASFNKQWDKYKRIDFKINAKFKEVIFNVGSHNTYISKSEKNIKDFDGIENFRIVKSQKVFSSNNIYKGLVIANAAIKKDFGLAEKGKPIKYKERYKELIKFYKDHLQNHNFENLKFTSIGFENISSYKVSFDRNKMVFKNGNTDINPITGMRNYGVFKEVENAKDIKFIFIYQNKDDANNLYKYLKNGYKGFPGLERYVGIPLTLANSVNEGKYKRLQYTSKEKLMEEYKLFEKEELKEPEYFDLFALVIGDFDKDNPGQTYYKLKLSLLKKGIPSQFINYRHIRNTSVFNYHLPNIAIGIHAKLGGIPWRIDSSRKTELVIGFNQERGASGEKFIAGSVFFDNHGYLKRTFSFSEQENKNQLIVELKNAVQTFLDENKEIERIIIHYYKSFSSNEKERIDKLLQGNFKINVPYAVVEVNDSKTKTELAFDPNYNYGMPVSGSYIKLTKKEYLLFNNNRFKEIAPVGVKDELPLKIKIHFADESGFSHKELIEQVYEFSRLIWKGLKQKSQPATCFYAKEIARFRANIDTDIPNNELTQKTPWII